MLTAAILIAILSLLIARIFHLAAYAYAPLAAETIAYGRARPPMSHRILAPWLARAALEVSGIGGFIHWTFVVATGFIAASLTATYLFLRLYYDQVWSLVGLLMAPVILLWSIDMPAADGFPQVFFFATAFICLVTKRPGLFAVVYVVALFNRETVAALLLPFAFVFWQEMSGKKLAGWLALLVSWTLIWKAILAPALLPGGRGPLAEFQLLNNIQSLGDVRHVLNPFAKNPFTILGYTYLFVPYAWRELPPFARTLCLCFLPYAGLMLVVARLSETRVYMEWTPLAALVCVAAFRRMIGLRPAG